MFCYVRNDSAGVTVHCALLSIKSKNSRIHFSKVFFVKGKGGRGRRARLLQEVSAPRPNQRGGCEPTTEEDTSKRKQRQKQEIEMERNVTRTRSLETGTADRAQDEPTDNENQKPPRKNIFSRLSIFWFSCFMSFSCSVWFQDFLEKLEISANKKIMQITLFISRQMLKFKELEFHGNHKTTKYQKQCSHTNFKVDWIHFSNKKPSF